MGAKNAHFTKDELEEYEELTYLSQKEILKAFSKYEKMDPIKVNKSRSAARIPCDRIRVLTQELRLNPFGDRICQVFNTGGDDGMSFDDFLDMYRYGSIATK
jgi:calcium and integrin-binding protein 1